MFSFLLLHTAVKQLFGQFDKSSITICKGLHRVKPFILLAADEVYLEIMQMMYPLP
jgi:hypothetical protein